MATELCSLCIDDTVMQLLCIIAFPDTIKYNGVAYSALYRARFLAAIIMELIAKENQ
jgi:hypothetical protein